MKIHPPILDIPPDNPYLNDLFGRKIYAESLLSLIENVDVNIVLSIDAPWGDGKTSFAKMWLADLKLRGIKCIYYDAYEHDYCDDPFVSFSAEIISLVENNFHDDLDVQKLKDDFKAKAKRIGGKVLTMGARIGTKALTLGIINNSDIDAIQDIKEDLAKDASDISTAIVGKIFDNYISEKNQVDEFKKKLSDLGQAVKKSQKFPLLIIIDELDRCRPDFALALLERVKHFYTADGISFILLANMNQMENYVRTIYGSGIDARNYLHKFITLTTTLPKSKTDQYDNDYAKYFHRLTTHHGINDRHDIGFIVNLFKYYNFSLREMEKCISLLTVYYSQLSNNSFNISQVVCLLAVLYMRFPNTFNALGEGTISFTELLDTTNLDKVPYLTNKEHFINFIEYLLLNDEEYKKMRETDQLQRYDQWLGTATFYQSIGRKEIIPYFYSELLKFKNNNIK